MLPTLDTAVSPKMVIGVDPIHDVPTMDIVFRRIVGIIRISLLGKSQVLISITLR